MPCSQRTGKAARILPDSLPGRAVPRAVDRTGPAGTSAAGTATVTGTGAEAGTVTAAGMETAVGRARLRMAHGRHN